MNSIKFNHHYEQLGFKGGDIAHFNVGKGFGILVWFLRTGPETARLVSVSEVRIPELPGEFVDYITKYIKHPKTRLVNLPQTFPMLRRYTDAGLKEYEKKIGVEFRVEIDELFE